MTIGEPIPRILTLMGSGETSPTMVKVHRSILDRLGARPVPAVLLDTPFGFQENAHELAIRVQNYFDESLQTPIVNASGIDPNNPENHDDRFLAEQLTTNVQRARYVFSGPGSPTYALNRWRESVVPQLLVEKMRFGGAVTFASAAALTLGALTLPVYEIYKVGEDPHWLKGLDLLAEAGVHAAIIPHYNNTEGGTHDTRFCYLGERRLSELERKMPSELFVLGIDEHTSCSFDLDAQTATIGGIGTVTVRKSGASTTFESGEVIEIAQLIAGAHGSGSIAPRKSITEQPNDFDQPAPALLLDLVHTAERDFHEAISTNNAPEATVTILGLEQSFHDWSTDSPGQDELGRARSSLRSMIKEFGEIAVQGLEDPAIRLAPFITLLISLRADARSNGRYQAADEIRDQLSAMGIELHDAPEGTSWVLTAPH